MKKRKERLDTFVDEGELSEFTVEAILAHRNDPDRRFAGMGYYGDPNEPLRNEDLIEFLRDARNREAPRFPGASWNFYSLTKKDVREISEYLSNRGYDKESI